MSRGSGVSVTLRNFEFINKIPVISNNLAFSICVLVFAVRVDVGAIADIAIDRVTNVFTK
jgi:hypothetical protein